MLIINAENNNIYNPCFLADFMKKACLLAVFIILVFLFSIMSFVPLGNSNSSVKIENSVVKALEKQEKVRVIVKFKEMPDKESLKKIMLNEKQNIKSTIKIKHDFGVYVSAFISKENLKELEKSDVIEKIEKEGVKHIFLQQSSPLINATTTFSVQQFGINVTGAGETACVIDTGINYSHSDFGSCSNTSFITGSCGKVIGGWDYCADDVSCITEDNNPMDSHGHGTYVSGIIAANGTIKGIAPDARIVAIKVCNSGGSCDDSDIKAGIDWCVNNASIYNISVISMSLGSIKNYTTYCDNVDDSANITGAINNAVLKNISVVVATGNSYNYTAIASPACIRNATAVGSTTKLDAISAFSNRNNITDLFAPGSNINSTSKNGLYEVLSGTSIATPHVSGAFLLLRQFKRAEKNQILTPAEIEDKLNDTGKVINDASSGLNFSRIDIYTAILNLDETKPNVSLISPTNNSATLQQNISFNCNATDLQLKNISLNVWNSTNSLINSTTTSASGSFVKANYNLTLNYGNYNWNCFACDNRNNCSYALANFSLTINQLIVNLTSPANNTRTNIAARNFTCNAITNNDLRNLTFYLWNSTSIIYNLNSSVSGLNNQTTFNYTFSIETSYLWNCLAFDNASNSAFASSNFSFAYDTILPSLTIISPLNNSWHNQARFNISLNEEGDSCLFSLNSGANISMTKFNSTYFNYTNSTIVQGSYNVSFYCNDSAGNLNSSSLIFFNIDKTPPIVNLISPADLTSSTTNAYNFTFNVTFNVTDNQNITNCNLIFDDSIINILTNVNNSGGINGMYNSSLSVGTHIWNVNCTDLAGNIGNSSSRSLTIGSTGGGGGGGEGGGGGGSTTKTYSISSSQFSSGYTKELAKDEKISFQLNNEQHNLKLNTISSNSVIIEISSKTQTATLYVGEEKKFNLNEDNYYDLLVRLNSITGSKADITIKEIIEEIKKADVNNTETNKTNDSIDNIGGADTGKISAREYFYIVIILIILMAVFFVIVNMRKKMRETGRK